MREEPQTHRETDRERERKRQREVEKTDRDRVGGKRRANVKEKGRNRDTVGTQRDKESCCLGPMRFNFES